MYIRGICTSFPGLAPPVDCENSDNVRSIHDQELGSRIAAISLNDRISASHGTLAMTMIPFMAYNPYIVFGGIQFDRYNRTESFLDNLDNIYPSIPASHIPFAIPLRDELGKCDASTSQEPDGIPSMSDPVSNDAHTLQKHQ